MTDRKKPGEDESPSRPDFSNVRGGGSSTAPSTAATTRTYVVVKDDTLSKIAKRHYGDPDQWRKIFEANRDQIKGLSEFLCVSVPVEITSAPPRTALRIVARTLPSPHATESAGSSTSP